MFFLLYNGWYGFYSTYLHRVFPCGAWLYIYSRPSQLSRPWAFAARMQAVTLANFWPALGRIEQATRGRFAQAVVAAAAVQSVRSRQQIK